VGDHAGILGAVVFFSFLFFSFLFFSFLFFSLFFFLSHKKRSGPKQHSEGKKKRQRHKSHLNLPSSSQHEKKKRKKKKREREVQPEKVKQICRTKGLTSADRSNKATLLLTVPRPDSSRLQRIHPRTYHDCNSRTNRLDISIKPAEPTQFGSRAKLYSNTTNTCGTNIVVSSTDSDLEAFSHNPADDSFAPLPDRTGANTKYLNERFLSY
jgi:hypothetical protein